MEKSLPSLVASLFNAGDEQQHHIGSQSSRPAYKSAISSSTLFTCLTKLSQSCLAGLEYCVAARVLPEIATCE